jgi:hypothetical protein
MELFCFEAGGWVGTIKDESSAKRLHVSGLRGRIASASLVLGVALRFGFGFGIDAKGLSDNSTTPATRLRSAQTPRHCRKFKRPIKQVAVHVRYTQRSAAPPWICAPQPIVKAVRPRCFDVAEVRLLLCLLLCV